MATESCHVSAAGHRQTDAHNVNDTPYGVSTIWRQRHYGHSPMRQCKITETLQQAQFLTEITSMNAACGTICALHRHTGMNIKLAGAVRVIPVGESAADACDRVTPM